MSLWHPHRWTAWSDPEFDTWGNSFQIRRCKDRVCNKHQRRGLRTMTPELTAAERATVERFEAAPDDPDSYAAAVERVARAICAKDYENVGSDWPELDEGERGIYRSLARAAIAAYRPLPHDHPASGHPGTAEREAVTSQPKRRLRACVEAWPECETGAYHPSCCRFPKSCSATVYSDEHVTEEDLEPRR